MITIDQKIAEYLNNWVVNGWPVGNFILCLIALVLALVLCGMIGFEREWKGRGAGLRTHLLVGVGSCLIMIISIYGFPGVFSEKRDVARLVAQVITGIGFLGAGVIVHRGGGGVKGLTTAATIWIVMAIGLACGSFNFILAIIGAFLIMVVLTVFRRVEVKINKHSPTILLSAPADGPILTTILAVSEQFDCTVHGLSTEACEQNGKRVIQISFQAVFASGEDRVLEYVSELEKQTNAVSIHLIGHK